jgi:hypothetical protein
MIYNTLFERISLHYGNNPKKEPLFHISWPYDLTEPELISDEKAPATME